MIIPAHRFGSWGPIFGGLHPEPPCGAGVAQSHCREMSFAAWQQPVIKLES